MGNVNGLGERFPAARIANYARERESSIASEAEAPSSFGRAFASEGWKGHPSWPVRKDNKPKSWRGWRPRGEGAQARGAVTRYGAQG